MSYVKDLDEYTEDELRMELVRRQSLRDKGVCDYCERPRDTKPPCRYPTRHAIAFKVK